MVSDAPYHYRNIEMFPLPFGRPVLVYRCNDWSWSIKINRDTQLIRWLEKREFYKHNRLNKLIYFLVSPSSNSSPVIGKVHFDRQRSLRMPSFTIDPQKRENFRLSGYAPPNSLLRVKVFCIDFCVECLSLHALVHTLILS